MNKTSLQRMQIVSPYLRWKPVLELCVYTTQWEHGLRFRKRMAFGSGCRAAGMDYYRATRPAESVWVCVGRVGVGGVAVTASQAIKKASQEAFSEDLVAGLCPGKEGVLLIYEPFFFLVNKNKTSGVITNSLLEGALFMNGKKSLWFLWHPNRTRAGMMCWRPSLRQSYCLSSPGPMQSPQSVVQEELGGGRSQILEKAVHHFSVTSIFIPGCIHGCIHCRRILL